MSDVNNSSANNNQASEHQVTVIDGCNLANKPRCSYFKAQEKTLLNHLEANKVEDHYHCRDGFCGACRVSLKQGQVNYPAGEPLAFVGEGEILTCCCVPVTNITIEID